MQQPRRVYVIQTWVEAEHLVLRLKEQNQIESKHFQTWAELLVHLQEQTSFGSRVSEPSLLELRSESSDQAKKRL